MADFDTTHLLKILRQHTSLPAVQGFDDTSCLRLLTSVLHGYIVPLIKAEWQEHLLSNEATTWVVPLVQGKREYVLPYYAVAASVRKAVLTGPDGARRPLRLYEVDKQEEWSTARQALPEGYTLRGGRLYLHPAPDAAAAGWSLRVQVLVRPARLVLPSACAQILDTNVGDVGGLYSVDGAPVGLIDGPVDVVRGKPPFETLRLSIAATTDSTDGSLTNFYFEPEDPQLEVGDWVCPVGTAPHAQIPVELLEVLATRAALEQLSTIGDSAVAQMKGATLGEQRKDATTLVTPRTGEARLQGNGMRKFRGASWNGTPY